MREEARNDTTIYKVVVNHEEFYSIWPADRENALGWNDAGKSGTREECLYYIREVWTDMRPLSLRKRLEQAGRDGAQEPEAFAAGGGDDEGQRQWAAEAYRRNVLTHLTDGVRAYVLDERLEITPAEVEGLLFVGGPVAHAADAAPDETAANFLPDPYADRPGERIYRTGAGARVTCDYRIGIVAGGQPAGD